MTSEFWIEGSLRRPLRPRPREEASHTGCRRRDLGAGLWDVEGMADTDLPLAEHWHRRHKALRMGLVDAVVAVVADRLRADVIATLDLRHFGSLSLPGTPLLWPRDLDARNARASSRLAFTPRRSAHRLMSARFCTGTT